MSGIGGDGPGAPARDPVVPPFESVAVLGLGVMGGSLARALSALGHPPLVTGWSPDAAEREAAVACGAVAAAPEAWHDAVREASLVVLAAPLSACCALLPEVVRVTRPDATLSDVASLKVPLARVAAEVGVTDRWVGAHPMAGSEQSGFGASRGDLFEGALVWTSAHESAGERVARVHALWRSLGARPAATGAEEHDRLMATASHLPQLLSNALARVLDEEGVGPGQLGPGGRDMTRLAGSSAAVWRDLLAHASPHLVAALAAVADEARRIAGLLEAGDLETLEELMRATARWRRP